MHARFATFQGSPDRVEELVRLSREQFVPAFQQMKGFRRIYGLADRASGRIASLSLWESEQAMRDSEGQAGPRRQQAAQTVGASDEPAVELYEIVHQADATGGAGGTGDAGGQVARVTTSPIAPERIDDLVRHIREENAPVMQRQPGFVRAYYCADRPGGRVLAVSFWQSREALQRAEGTINEARERAGQVAGTQATMASEVYEVMVEG
jgi:heme-degrading monooxygenase HmoA